MLAFKKTVQKVNPVKAFALSFKSRVEDKAKFIKEHIEDCINDPSFLMKLYFYVESSDLKIFNSPNDYKITLIVETRFRNFEYDKILLNCAIEWENKINRVSLRYKNANCNNILEPITNIFDMDIDWEMFLIYEFYNSSNYCYAKVVPKRIHSSFSHITTDINFVKEHIFVYGKRTVHQKYNTKLMINESKFICPPSFNDDEGHIQFNETIVFPRSINIIKSSLNCLGFNIAQSIIYNLKDKINIQRVYMSINLEGLSNLDSQIKFKSDYYLVNGYINIFIGLITPPDHLVHLFTKPNFSVNNFSDKVMMDSEDSNIFIEFKVNYLERINFKKDLYCHCMNLQMHNTCNGIHNMDDNALC